MRSRILVQDGDTDERKRRRILSFRLAISLPEHGKEGTLQIRCKEASARWFHASLPQLQHTDAGRHSLGHNYPNGTEFRKIRWIKLHDPSDEFLFSDYVP